MLDGGYFEIAEDVTEIPEGAFANNKQLKHIDLRNVISIGARAFQDCVNLESVKMSNVAVIGSGAFEFCRSLRSITIGNVTDIGERAFFCCSLLDIPVLPETLKFIGAGAFSHTALRRIDLHWLSEIPSYLFSYCTSLTYADISGVKVISDDAFTGCKMLSEVKFGSTEKIGARAFQRCGSFEPAFLPDGLKYIGDDAFDITCAGMIVPNSVSHIGKNCFGPVDRRKNVSIYQSTIYEFRNYFRDDCINPEEEDGHFYLWESSIDVTVLDDKTGKITGFLPLYSDLDPFLRETLKKAFRADNTFDYEIFDTDFFGGMSWNMRARDRLAVMRLKNPYGLTLSARAQYTEYLSRHLKRIAQRAIRERDIDMLIFLCDFDLILKDNITGLIDYSISLSASECTAFLLERQSEMNWHKDPLLDEL